MAPSARFHALLLAFVVLGSIGSLATYAHTVEIYAPDDAWEFRKGCGIDPRCIVRDPAGGCYNPWSDCVEVYVDDVWYVGNGELVDWDPNNTWAKFRLSENDGYEIPTWFLERGSHKLTMEFHRGPGVHASDDQTFRIFAMDWPEDGIIWDPQGTCQAHENVGHTRGVDIFFTEPNWNPAGIATENPVSPAHSGTLGQRGSGGDGGYRFWWKYGKKVRAGLISWFPADGIPKYTEKYVFTYYCHLDEYPEEDVSNAEEDNTGNASGTGSHLHFGVFLNETNAIPPYNNDYAVCPEDWLILPNPVRYVTGNVRRQNGTGIDGVKVYIQYRGHATTLGSGGFRCYVRPGTYRVTPVKSGWTFVPDYRDVTVTTYHVTGVDFTGQQQ